MVEKTLDAKDDNWATSGDYIIIQQKPNILDQPYQYFCSVWHQSDFSIRVGMSKQWVIFVVSLTLRRNEEEWKYLMLFFIHSMHIQEVCWMYGVKLIEKYVFYLTSKLKMVSTFCSNSVKSVDVGAKVTSNFPVSPGINFPHNFKVNQAGICVTFATCSFVTIGP
jgi:hypothetical protein